MHYKITNELVDFFVEIGVDDKIREVVLETNSIQGGNPDDLIELILEYTLKSKKDIPERIRNMIIAISAYDDKSALVCINLALISAIDRNKEKIEA